MTQGGKTVKQQNVKIDFDNSTYEFEILGGETFARRTYYVRVLGQGK